MPVQRDRDIVSKKLIFLSSPVEVEADESLARANRKSGLLNSLPVLLFLSVVACLFFCFPSQEMAAVVTYLVIFTVISSALAYDPDMLQDLCVVNTSAGIKVNGFTCKAETNITEADFFFDGLAKPGKVNNSVGSLVTVGNVEKIPGLNTLGVSLSRIDYAPEGLNPPHTHPRATEMIFVLDGELDVGFITTANKLISKTVKKGEVFVFPRGLVHFQKNNDDKAASVISAFNSQLPGTQSIAMTLFTSTPAVPDNVLTKAFQVGTKEIDKIKTKLAPKKS
ncbi:hypothetical protein POTOM_010668 [Populus tomentosa]|uniref:Cupin type-1 domain-containing protein n=1 Tax=Populus tomentosa TaxID=118781 RepID=A0A8X8DCM5_POPTO|nr:hypothetical protein POTOM_010668 [Populus tomentosa]